MTTRITAFIILLSLTLPLSALAMEEIPVDEAIQAADHDLASDSSYKQASVTVKKHLRNAEIRRQIVDKTQAQLDEMQKKLDREIDVRLAKAFNKDGGLLILATMKAEFVSRFKAEMFLYAIKNRSSKVKLAYRNAEGDSGDVNNYLAQALKDKVSFGNDIESILNKISADLKEETGNEVDREWISKLTGLIVDEFNK